jgi:hypothetical protein
VLDYSDGKREGAGALLVLPAVPPPVPPWLRVLRWVLVLICIGVVCVFAMLCGSIVAHFLHAE